MKKFIFRLETLLRVRRIKENHLKRDVAHIEQRCAQVREKEKILQTQIHALVEEMQQKKEEGDLQFQETYLQIYTHLTDSRETTAQQLTSLTEQKQVAQMHLKQAIQERKVIEKIKEKQYNGWCTRIDHEGERLDELGLNTTTSDL